MKLTKEDLEKIKHTELATLLDLSIGSYFSKEAYVDYAFWFSTSELIGSLIGRDLGFITPNIKIIMPKETNDSERWIISENLNNYGKFYLAQDLGIDDVKNSSLPSILASLKLRFPDEDLSSLYEDVVKLYLFDIFLCNGDRCSVNWGVVRGEDGLHVAIFDNETLMDDSVVYDISSFYDGSTWLKDVEYNSKETRIRKLKEDLTHFLEDPFNPYLDTFQEMLDIMTPEYFKSIIDKIQNEHTITTNEGEIPYDNYEKDIYLNIYRENYDLIKSIWLEVKRKR